MDVKVLDSEIISFPNDESRIDITQPITYSNVQMIGPTGPNGSRGIDGGIGPTGPSAPKVPSLTESICDTRLMFSPIMFHFPIQNGIYNPYHIITNSPNRDIIELRGAFNVIFHINGFIRMEIKLYTYDNKTIMLTDFTDKMIDISSGPCANLIWIGYVNSGTRFFIAGGVDNATEGYWHINII